MWRSFAVIGRGSSEITRCKKKKRKTSRAFYKSSRYSIRAAWKMCGPTIFILALLVPRLPAPMSAFYPCPPQGTVIFYTKCYRHGVHVCSLVRCRHGRRRSTLSQQPLVCHVTSVVRYPRYHDTYRRYLCDDTSIAKVTIYRDIS